MKRIKVRSRGWIMQPVCFITFAVALASGLTISYPLAAEDQTKSSADQAAEELVSLSADTIVSVLRKDPSFLLRVKRQLVKKAYEQGRILDARDLEDDALFRLIQEDQSVRVLITREIERRYFTRSNGEDGQGAAGKNPKEAAGQKTYDNSRPSDNSGRSPRENREDQTESYDGANPRDGTGSEERMFPNDRANPEMENEPWSDPRRQVEQTQSQHPPNDPYGELPNEQTPSPFDRHSGSPNLLTASTNDPSANPLGRPKAPPDEYRATVDPNIVNPGWLPANRSGRNPRFDNPELDEERGPGQRTERRMRDEARRAREVPAEQRGLRHRPNPYADVPSLYDLYAQYGERSRPVERFGLEVFRNGTGNFDKLPMDMPVGPEYVLGPGDGLILNLWGGVTQRFQSVVDRQGRVMLPEVGAVEVAGRNLGDVQRIVQTALRTQFRDVEADISLARLRTVRVYVVGDVERPGAYDVSSLSTPLNAVYEAGGPTEHGSLRVLRHYRGKQLLQEIDVYDLLLHGIRADLKGLQPGDTVLVPALGPEVTIEGMVRRPAIYELGPERSLAEVLELAGGVLQSGALRHVDVERVEAHLSRTMLLLDIPEDHNPEAVTRALEDFPVQDGDRIKISPILPYAEKTVYLEGHAFRPGKFAYREGMKITDVIKSYSDLLPEPSRRHAEIIRLSPPDSMPVVLAFNLEEALSGKNQDLVLQPFDTIRVFGRFDFEDPPVITVNGAVRDPGDHLSNGVTCLRDAIHLAGGTTADAELEDAQVFRKSEDGKLKVISVNLVRALAGDDRDNIPLQPRDRIFVHKSAGRVDPPTVKIEGEVEQPGKYPLGEAMTAADLVRVAGGFKRGAYTQVADLTSYGIERGTSVVGESRTIPMAHALAGEPDTDVRLHDGDVLTIRQLAGWNDVGATITLKGEVLHPGTYGIREGERLSSILARAGDFRSDAYPYGVIFERAQVRSIEESNRTVLLREVQDDGTALRATPDASPEDKTVKEASLLQWQRTMERLQNTAPSGRLVIHISRDTKRWANTAADIEVRAGDVMYVPKRPNVVLIDGAVYNPTAVTFKHGKDASWYLRQAGGPTNMANQKAIFVIRADGSVAGGAGGLFNGGVGSAQLLAGDMVVVPEKAFSGTTKWKNTLQVAQLLQAVAFSVSLGKTF